MMDQYLRPAKSQSKWYRLFSDQKSDPSAVSSWNVGASKLNSSYSRIGRKAGISSISGQHRVGYIRIPCEDGNRQLERLRLFATRQRVLIGAFLCQLTCQSADIMASLCGICVCVCVNIFSSKSKMPRDMLLLLKGTLTIEDDKS